MCGISAVIHYQKQVNCQCLLNIEDLEKSRLSLIRNRGPNSYATHSVNFPNVDLQFHASVLHLRGPSIVIQPLFRANNNNVFLWNGEIFGGISVSEDENDTTKLLSLLEKCKTEQEVLNVFCSIHGPWSFIFFFKHKMQVYFGRDILGRRSLLWREVTNSDGCKLLTISSVGDTETKWNNIPATGIFCLNLEEDDNVNFHPWSRSISGNTVQDLNFPFSVNKGGEITSPINKELLKSNPETDVNYLEFEKLIEDISEDNFEGLFERVSEHRFFKKKMDTFLDVLGESVKLRVNNQPSSCLECQNPDCKHKTIAILFSGGLDCSVLAVLTHWFLPSAIPIDLINVSFEHAVVVPKDKKSKKQLYQNTYDSPDRLSALKSYQELKTLFSDRRWNFVEVNVEKLELQHHRDNHIQALIFPQQTVLDDSIGCALWFASRGQGKLKCNEDYISYTSPARIVLLGMGADEQLGGYSRHRGKFQKAGWNGIIDEIQLEIDRISERNLARDDRIVSDSGKEARFPYLDENVVAFLNNLPIWVKANLKLPRGVGEKLLLRTAAYKLGLKFAAVLPKRAIQFGSRIARLETKSEKGSDICTRFHSMKV